MMAEKKAKPAKPQKQIDRHKSGYLIRLPESYRAALQELRQKTRRPMTVEAQIALDAHLKANGISPPQGMST